MKWLWRSQVEKFIISVYSFILNSIIDATWISSFGKKLYGVLNWNTKFFLLINNVIFFKFQVEDVFLFLICSVSFILWYRLGNPNWDIMYVPYIVINIFNIFSMKSNVMTVKNLILQILYFFLWSNRIRVCLMVYNVNRCTTKLPTIWPHWSYLALKPNSISQWL